MINKSKTRYFYVDTRLLMSDLDNVNDQRLSQADSVVVNNVATEEFVAMPEAAQINYVDSKFNSLNVSGDGADDEIDIITENHGDAVDDAENDNQEQDIDDIMDISGGVKNNTESKPQQFKHVHFEPNNNINNNRPDLDVDTFAVQVMQKETGGTDPDSLNTWLQGKYDIFEEVSNKIKLRSLTAADESKYKEYLHIVWFSASRVAAMKFSPDYLIILSKIVQFLCVFCDKNLLFYSVKMCSFDFCFVFCDKNLLFYSVKMCSFGFVLVLNITGNDQC